MTQNRYRVLSTIGAATMYLQTSDRTVQRMAKRNQVHDLGKGNPIRIAQEEIKRIRPLYSRFRASGLPVYGAGASGTLWPATVAAKIIGCTPQTVNNWLGSGVLTGSCSPHKNYVDQENIDQAFPGRVDGFWGSLNSWR